MSLENTPFYWVDAFTERPFSGNPAAVCIPPAALEPALMQNLAAEFGLSETAFVERRPDNQWNLRWFTPKAEVRLCGHATLAAATALWSHEPTLGNTLTFHTLSGPLTATRTPEGMIELVFPARPPQQCDIPVGLLEAVRVPPSDVLWCGRDLDDYILQLPSEEHVKALKPDYAQLGPIETRGIIFTARSSTKERDFISRFFAPKVGVDEDPVTGSAHCCLTPFWAERLDNTCLKAEQLSKRGGRLEVELRGDRVALPGRSCIIVSGTLGDC